MLCQFPVPVSLITFRTFSIPWITNIRASQGRILEHTHSHAGRYYTLNKEHRWISSIPQDDN